jgi:hypothetical protein
VFEECGGIFLRELLSRAAFFQNSNELLVLLSMDTCQIDTLEIGFCPAFASKSPFVFVLKLFFVFGASRLWTFVQPSLYPLRHFETT